MENQKPKKQYLIKDIIIKPRAPKGKRQFLMKKEADEYIQICRDEICHPVIKRIKKSRHFLKWSIKLIAPNFLIGHPNLWDNLKTLRKHPQFKPLRMALVAWILLTLTLGSAGIYSLNQAVKIFAVSPITDTFTDTTKIATSAQIAVDTGAGQVKLLFFTCGDTFTDLRDNETYATVLIGSQCWMAEYLNYGTMTDVGNSQGSDCPSVAATEKYCYNNTESICTSDGALYQWAQMMCGAASCNGTGESQPACTSPVQGICPSGWHIPSHYEFTALEREVCDSGSCATDFLYDTSTTGWRGTDEGTQLKVGGSSGFEGIFAGYRNNSTHLFGGRGSTAYIWSSLQNSVNAWKRTMGSNTTVYRGNSSWKLEGYSIRCIKD